MGEGLELKDWTEETWRTQINALKAPAINEAIPPPEMEKISKTKPGNWVLQRIYTEVWVYTNPEEQIYGSEAFQAVEVGPEVSTEKLLKLLDKRRRKSA